MRLSRFLVAGVLVVSAAFLAQQVAGAPGTNGGGSHGGGFSGGSVSTSASMSSSSSHVSSAGAPRTTSSTTSHPVSSSEHVKSQNNVDKKSGPSFWHPFRKETPVARASFFPAPCLHKPCGVCPAGQGRSSFGGCVTLNNSCMAGQSWSGFACYSAYAWSNNCTALARQLENLQREMQGNPDSGQSIRYRMLRQQYEQCMMRYGGRFGAGYLLDDMSLLETP